MSVKVHSSSLQKQMVRKNEQNESMQINRLYYFMYLNNLKTKREDNVHGQCGARVAPKGRLQAGAELCTTQAPPPKKELQEIKGLT